MMYGYFQSRLVLRSKISLLVFLQPVKVSLQNIERVKEKWPLFVPKTEQFNPFGHNERR